jgi:HPt (histidine-containing phosphotransfer) domain-containing protein
MGMENELIDWEQLDMMADGYTPEFVEIYRDFLNQTPELLLTLERHLIECDLNGAREAAHKIKGSSANFGFLGVSAPMFLIEVRAKEEGTLEGAAERLSEARQNFERARAEIHEKRGI